ncbi:response regulator [Opitutus sp. GAS368]|uniref:response regulator n=1 Tax=Opitutus sp. GAS368 TaxID=1882749 RepID=UPI00087DA9AB|nr:response regulator [Opitutus sp. GAS368]SDS38298.1 PAS/PAC sensor hybrid histidine kinase [Opitutus sp. GAS368]
MSSLPPIDRPLRIFHLEDNATDRALIHARLRQGGLACEVRTAVTRGEFEIALTEAAYDLIISDFTLPSYDGATALALAQRVRPGVPFLFVSGTIGEDRAVESLKSGATDYVLKNNLERLVPAVRRALREAAERAARHQAEESLRTAEARLREMAETIRDVFWVTTPDGSQLLYVSAAYAQVWGRPVAEAYARPASWLEAVHPEDQPKVRVALQQLAQGTEYRIEYRVVRPDGTERQVEDRRYPVLNPAGKMERAVGVATDITERRQLEEQLRQAQKMEAIGQLAGGIAHDFNNMLTVINGRARLLMDTGELPPKVTDSLREIYVAGGRAAGLTRQLLVFSRKHFMHSTALDLNELIEAVVQMLRRMIGEDIELEVQAARPLPPILADASMLEQVLMNLAVNARDAMPRGGRLTITTECREISETAPLANPEAVPGSHVCLRVGDTGCGMSPETLARIFEPFFTTKDVGKGTGLGLSTVFGIVKYHHGWVEVSSEVGAGTEFRIYLPVTTADFALNLPATDPVSVTGGQETILLVEDEVPVRELAKLILQEYGYRVLTAGSGLQALDVWKWHADRIALLLTDLVMPDDMSGLELAEKLRTEKPGLKIVYTSGYNSDTSRPGFAALAGTNFLHKPYQPAALAQIVRATLDQDRAPAVA